MPSFLLIKKILLVVFVLIFGLSISQNITPVNTSSEGLVKWLNFDEAQEQNKKLPKPFLIDIYTDWCGWCKHMIRTTYSDPGLANYINNNFYPVKFNAETKDTIEYNGQKYFNEGKSPKSPHQLAIKFLGNSLSYPSTIFVNNNFQFNLLTQGYLDVRKIEPLLIFTLENIFRTTSYEDFSQKFSLTFYDSLKKNQPDRVKWLTWDEAIAAQKKKEKKILISISTQWCTGCRVMNKTTFCDSAVAEFINKNFYLVELNAESLDTLKLGDKIFPPSSNPGFPFHSLAFELTKKNFILPSTVFMDEKLSIIESVPFYQHPKGISPILKYFGENYYLKFKWDDFLTGLKNGTLNQKEKTK